MCVFECVCPSGRQRERGRERERDGHKQVKDTAEEKVKKYDE